MPIERYRLQFDCPESLAAPLAYALYAELLRRGPAAFGEQVHQTAFTPVAHHLDGTCWQVSLLGQTAIDALAPVLQQAESFRLDKHRLTLPVAACVCDRIDAPDDFFAQPLRRARLQFVSPTAFKSNGAYQLLPTQRLLLQSLILRWNGCFPDCPIEDDGGGLERLAAGLLYTDISLTTKAYRIKGQNIPGIVGQISVENTLPDFHGALCSALLQFAPYAGIGIKTGLGMGGVALR